MDFRYVEVVRRKLVGCCTGATSSFFIVETRELAWYIRVVEMKQPPQSGSNGKQYS